MFLGRDMTYPERFFLGGDLFASLMAAHAQDTEEDSASRGYSAVIEEVLVTAQQREEGIPAGNGQVSRNHLAIP